MSERKLEAKSCADITSDSPDADRGTSEPPGVDLGIDLDDISFSYVTKTVLTKTRKSESDTAIMAKRSTHLKARSKYGLDSGQTQNLREFTDECDVDIGQDCVSSSSSLSTNTKMDDSDFSDNRSKSQMDIPDTASKIKSKVSDMYSDVRHRKLKSDSFDQDKVKEISKHHTTGTACGESTGSSYKTNDIPGDVNDEEDDHSRRETKAYYLCWMILVLFSLLTRLYNIELPAHICWDETHFGKMGSWYINRTFFFDVHPPLGKMLIGFAGIMTGYNGSFPFQKPGDPYEDTNYVGMRVFCAVLGAWLVPLAYQSVWLLTHSILAAIFAGALILFDTGTLTLSRHILLDPILMFFILLSTYSCLKFLQCRMRPFSLIWWVWMGVTGVSLSGAIGVKFVGLFVILLVGYTTAADLWNLLGDLSISMVTLCKHLAARVIGLIVLPVLVYSLLFVVHFRILNHSGNGDGFFSSAFQSQLIGNRLYNVSMPQYIAYGSIITLKQRRTGGAYLHSHAHLYPEEHPPRQQQITTYSHKDDNNRWKIKWADRETHENEEVTLIQNGHLVRLEHVATRRNLHSHREPAPLSKHHFQVSGYGQNGTGDANDIWLVEIEGGGQGDTVQAVRSKVKFIHYHVRCLLHSHDKKLPKWGWEQLEVTCQPNLRDATSVWSVEEVIDARLPNVSFEVYSPSFVEKFIESHAVMTQGNSGLKPKEGEITSRPWQWVLDYRGQVFSGQDHRIYMLGNPVIFWSLLALKLIFLLVWTAFTVSCKRSKPMHNNLRMYCERTMKVCWWLLLAWFLHYCPFWGMSRVLYFHHYFPAFLFSAMFGGVMLDLLITLICVCLPENLAVTIFNWCLLIICVLIIFSFYLFYPLAYGMSGPMAAEESSMMHRLKWMESWDI